jgi:hypothetical protein
MTDSEAFAAKLTGLFGREAVLRKIDSTTPGLAPVTCFIYRDVPQAGMMTAVTHGLSLADHPDWRYGKPELILTVRSADESWALAMAFIAERYRGEKSFTYGSLFSLEKPISSESPIRGFLVFVPAVLDHETLKITLPTRTVNLAGMYPIHAGEIELIQKTGLEEFWRQPELDLYDVTRPDVPEGV